MDWDNLGQPCQLVPTFTNGQFKEGKRMPYCLKEPNSFLSKYWCASMSKLKNTIPTGNLWNCLMFRSRLGIIVNHPLVTLQISAQQQCDWCSEWQNNVVSWTITNVMKLCGCNSAPGPGESETFQRVASCFTTSHENEAFNVSIAATVPGPFTMRYCDTAPDIYIVHESS